MIVGINESIVLNYTIMKSNNESSIAFKSAVVNFPCLIGFNGSSTCPGLFYD